MLLAELEWMGHLSDNGIRLAKPIQFCNFEKVIKLELGDDVYWLTFFEHTSGKL